MMKVNCNDVHDSAVVVCVYMKVKKKNSVIDNFHKKLLLEQFGTGAGTPQNLGKYLWGSVCYVPSHLQS